MGKEITPAPENTKGASEQPMTKADYVRLANEEFSRFEKSFLERQKAVEAEWDKAEKTWKMKQEALADPKLKALKADHDRAFDAARRMNPAPMTSAYAEAVTTFEETDQKWMDHLLKSGSKDLLQAAVDYYTAKFRFSKMKMDALEYDLKRQEKEILGHPLPTDPSATQTDHYSKDLQIVHDPNPPHPKGFYTREMVSDLYNHFSRDAHDAEGMAEKIERTIAERFLQ